MQLQDGLELSLEHFLQACVQVSGEICMVSLENVLYLQSNQNNDRMSCFTNGSLFTQVLPFCGCWTFLKANESPGLKACFGALWTCAQCTGGPLCEVFCTGGSCTCTESTCFVVIAGAEGVVVLKGVSISGALGTVLELYWHCMALHLFHLSCRIWKTLDIPSSVPLAVPFPVLA